jgi:hypothetical protein
MISTLYVLNTSPQWRFPECVRQVEFVSHVNFGLGRVCKVLLTTLPEIWQLHEEVTRLLAEVRTAPADRGIRADPRPDHYLRFGSIAGGCQPTAHQRRRAATMSAWFIRNATTVARPIAIVPSIFVPSRLQAE